MHPNISSNGIKPVALCGVVL